MMRSIFQGLLGIFLLSQIWCNSNDLEFLEQGNEFFPLRAGYYWMLQSEDGRRQLVRRVTAIRRTADIIMAEVTDSTYIDSESYITSVALFCYGVDGSVERIIKNRDLLTDQSVSERGSASSGNSVWYKMNADSGESWIAYGKSLTNGFARFTITLESRDDTVVAYGRVFGGCLRILIDEDSSDDEEYYEWFAAGIGLVKTRSKFWSEKALLLRTHSVEE